MGAPHNERCVLRQPNKMNGALHLVIAPATAQLTPPDGAPIVISCKAIKIAGTLIIFADASSPSMTETQMIDAVFAQLRPSVAVHT